MTITYYKIEDKTDPSIFYIGSTKHTLRKRICNHKLAIKQFKNRKLYDYILQKENLLDAAKRELEEETSIKSVKFLGKTNGWLQYYLPKNLLGKIWVGKYGGQKQKWFFMKFLGNNDEINVKTQKPEFLDWKWIVSTELPKIAVEFKIEIYKKLADEIELNYKKN